MVRYGFSFVHAFLLATLLAFAGCGREEPRILGRFQPQQDVSHIRDITPAPEQVTVVGNVEAVCPTVGCWLRLKDGDSRIHVELVGFTVSRNRLGVGCKVQGTVVEKDGRVTLLAGGVSFDR